MELGKSRQQAKETEVNKSNLAERRSRSSDLLIMTIIVDDIVLSCRQ